MILAKASQCGLTCTRVTASALADKLPSVWSCQLVLVCTNACMARHNSHRNNSMTNPCADGGRGALSLRLRSMITAGDCVASRSRNQTPDTPNTEP